MTTIGSDTFNAVSMGTLNAVGCYQLGLAILNQSLRYAFLGLVGAETSRKYAQRVTQSVMFVQGSGLERCIETFGMPFDPDVVRDGFYAAIAARTG